MNHSHRFFRNQDCEYFPCHSGANPERFNCMFCYCPLYALGDQCGGNCKYIAGEVKDCSGCLIPHQPEGYDYINSKFELLAELAKANHKKEG